MKEIYTSFLFSPLAMLFFILTLSLYVQPFRFVDQCHCSCLELRNLSPWFEKARGTDIDVFLRWVRCREIECLDLRGRAGGWRLWAGFNERLQNPKG